jgi:hypothetical protein
MIFPAIPISLPAYEIFSNDSVLAGAPVAGLLTGRSAEKLWRGGRRPRSFWTLLGMGPMGVARSALRAPGPHRATGCALQDAPRNAANIIPASVNPDRSVTSTCARRNAQASQARTFFLKKRSKRLLQFQVFVPPVRSATASSKSLLVLFFRKERLPCTAYNESASSQVGIRSYAPGARGAVAHQQNRRQTAGTMGPSCPVYGRELA